MAKQSGGDGGGSKVLLIILGSVGVLLLICCGAGGFFAYKGYQVAANMMTQEPAKIREIQAGIADITIPDAYVPQRGMNFDIAGTSMKMAMYISGGGGGQLMLMQMQQPGNAQASQAQFEQQMQQQNQGTTVQEESRSVRTFRINGQDSDFAFVKGTNTQTNQAVRQVTGVFPAKAGTGFLMIMEPEETWDEAAIVEMLESLGPEVTEGSSDSPVIFEGSEASGTSAATPDGSTSAVPEDAGVP